MVLQSYHVILLVIIFNNILQSFELHLFITLFLPDCFSNI